MTPTNSDNITSHIARAYVEQRVSKKDNRPYNVLILKWLMSNGNTYEQTVFLSAEQVALIDSSVSVKESQVL